jgi:hypothetical protein
MRVKPGDPARSFLVAPDDYDVIAVRAGDFWWGNPSVRRRISVSRDPVRVHLLPRDESNDNCGD